MKAKTPIYQIKSIGGFEIEVLTHQNEYDFREIHRHNYNEIFIFHKGKGNHLIDFQNFSITDNSIHLVSPGQIHRLERELDSNGFVIKYSKDFFYPEFQEKDLGFISLFNDNSLKNPYLSLSPIQINYLNKLVEMMILECSEEHPNKIPIQSLLKTALFKIIEWYKSSSGIMIQIQGNSSDVFFQFKKALELNFLKERKVQFYADLLNITPGHLNHLSNNAIGKNAKDVIIERIILEIKRLLVSSVAIKQIAGKLNFDDVSNFTKFFKTNTDLTPQDFIDQYR